MFKWYVSRSKVIIGFGAICLFVSTGWGFDLITNKKISADKAEASITQNTTKQPPFYKSYKEWKTQMVENAKQRLEKSKLNFELRKKVGQDKKNKDPNLSQQIAKEQLQLFMSTELSITDYFVGYLNKQTNLEEAIKSTSGKLTADEVAELMSAFAYNFNRKEATEAQAFINASPSRTSD